MSISLFYTKYYIFFLRSAGTPASLFVFQTPNPMSTKEMAYDRVTMQEKGRKKQKAFENEMDVLVTQLKLYKPNGQYHAERDGMADMFSDARKEMEGKETPDPNEVVPAFLNHPDTKAMEDLILESCQNGHVPADDVFNAMGVFLMIRIMCKMGNRSDIMGNMTW